MWTMLVTRRQGIIIHIFTVMVKALVMSIPTAITTPKIMGIPALNKETRIPTIDDFLEDIFCVNQDYVYDHEIF